MQRTLTVSLKLSCALLMLLTIAGSIQAQTTSFTYQGRLTDNILPANGPYDFQFRLFDAAAVGTQIGGPVDRPNIQVAGGIFKVELDFGAAAFPGASRWLEISARPAGGTFTTLTPRQLLTSTPYAVRSLNATTADNATQLNGQPAAQYVLTNDPRLSDARPPTANSANYIQNTTNQQANSNFSISGTGTAKIFNQSGAGGYQIGGEFYLRSGPGNSLLVGTGTSLAGNNNTLVGVSAGSSLTGGGGNTYVGRSAGTSDISGSRNTSLGFNANIDGTVPRSNATAVGADAIARCSNCVILGSIPPSSGFVNVGIGTDNPTYRLEVIGTARINNCEIGVNAGCASDLRFKRNVTPLPRLLDKVVQLQPVNFFWRTSEFPQKHFGNTQSYGLIAQEAETILPELVSEDKQGYKMVDYGKLPLLLLQSVRELKQENDTLQQTNTALHQQNAELQKRISAVEQKLETLLKR